MSLLKLQNVNTGYGKKQVLFNVSLQLEAGESVLLIGSNGSGKSTLLKVIYRMLPLWGQSSEKSYVEYNNLHILEVKSHELIQKGMVYIPQKNELFDGMTVQQNLQTSVLHLNSQQVARERLDEVLDQLPTLAQRRKQLTSQLSGGERKQLSLGMAMMNKPKLLMLDEPLAGVAADRIDQVKKIVEGFKEKGTTLLIVEHRVKEFFDFADRIIGLKLGHLSIDKFDSLEKIKPFLV